MRQSDGWTDEEAEASWLQKEKDIKTEESRNELQGELHAELNPRRHCLHQFFVVIKAIAILAAFNMGLGQIIGIAYEFVEPIQYVLRVYVVVLCIMVIFNEMEWTVLTRDSALLRIWISRGLIYMFIGVLGLEENDVSPRRDGMSQHWQKAALNYIKVVAWCIVAIGILYTLMGLFCLQIVYNRLREDYKDRIARGKQTARTTSKYGVSKTGDVV